MPRCLRSLTSAAAGLIDALAVLAQIPLRKIAVLVPAAMEQLHKRHTTFGHAAGQDAQLAANVPGSRESGPYNSLKIDSDSRSFHQVGNRRLHSIGHFILGNPGLDLGITDFVKLLAR